MRGRHEPSIKILLVFNGALTCVAIWSGVKGCVGWVEGRVRRKMSTRILAVLSRVARVLPYHRGGWVVRCLVTHRGGKRMEGRRSRVDVEVHIDVHIHTSLLIFWVFTCTYLFVT